MPVVQSPMFISSRLMAALKIEGGTHELDPPGGTVHIEASGREADTYPPTGARTSRSVPGRVAYGCVIEDDNGKVLYEGDGIRSGVGSKVNYAQAMATTLHFIAHDAELYRLCMGDWANADEDHQPNFNEAVAEWAYLNSDEIEMAAYDLDPDA